MMAYAERIYSPGRLVQIDLNGPKARQCPWGAFPGPPAKLPASDCSKRLRTSAISGGTINSRKSDAIRIKTLRSASCMPQRKKERATLLSSSTDIKLKKWDGDGPFYLSLLSQDPWGVEEDPAHKTSASTVASTTSHNKILAGRRLQQLIDVATFSVGSDDYEVVPVQKRTTTTRPMTTQTAALARTSAKDTESEIPDPPGLLDSLARLQFCSDEKRPSRKNWVTRAPSSRPSSCDTRPSAGLSCGEPCVHGADTERSRWACRRTIMARVSPPLCKVKVKPPVPASAQRVAFYKQIEVSHKEANNHHSRVWDSALRRRNPSHTQVLPEPQSEKATRSIVRPVMLSKLTKRGCRSIDSDLDDNLSTQGQTIRTWLEMRNGQRKDSLTVEKLINSQENTSSAKEKTGDTDDTARLCDKSPQNGGVEEKVEDNQPQTFQPKEHSAVEKDHGLGQKRENGSRGGKEKHHFHDSPPEVILPPYSQTGRKKERLNSATMTIVSQVQGGKLKDEKSGFWHLLADEVNTKDKVNESDRGKNGKKDDAIQSGDCNSCEVYLRPPQRFEALADSNAAEDIDLAKVAPMDVIRSCQSKGYEILRKLKRGKFRENIGLYLASNEENPKFSPVEVTVVTLPSRSLARCFLEASFTDNSASRRRQGFACRHTNFQMLPAHRNLLTRLHVFTSGCCVYQISSYCSWPPLASLLQPSPDDAPPTKSSTTLICGHLSPNHAPLSQRSPSDPARLSPPTGKRVSTKGAAGVAVGIGCDVSGLAKSSESVGVQLQESARRTIFRQICEGLRHLHDHGLLHGDLNCSNVLVTDKLQVKLAGYGPCCLHTPWESSPGESCDPPLADPYDMYIPPEIMARRSYGRWAKSSDIWCLGMTLLHMTLGKVTPQVNSVVRLRRSKQFKTLCLLHVRYQLGLLLESLLQVRPVDRPRIDTVLEHAWFSDGTDLAQAIGRLSREQATLRTDGRTFPLPKRIRQAFLKAQSDSEVDLTWVKDSGGNDSTLTNWHRVYQDNDVDHHCDDDEEEEEEDAEDNNDACA